MSSDRRFFAWSDLRALARTIVLLGVISGKNERQRIRHIEETTMVALIGQTRSGHLPAMYLDAALAFQNALWDRSEGRSRPKAPRASEVVQLGLRSLKVRSVSRLQANAS